GRTGDVLRLDVLLPHVPPAGDGHAGRVLLLRLPVPAAGNAAGPDEPAGGGRRGLRDCLDRPVRRPQVRRPQAEFPHRPGLPADRPGLGDGEVLPADGLALLSLWQAPAMPATAPACHRHVAGKAGSCRGGWNMAAVGWKGRAAYPRSRRAGASSNTRSWRRRASTAAPASCRPSRRALAAAIANTGPGR